jgi:hypothetical protein
MFSHDCSRYGDLLLSSLSSASHSCWGFFTFSLCGVVSPTLSALCANPRLPTPLICLIPQNSLISRSRSIATTCIVQHGFVVEV